MSERCRINVALFGYREGHHLIASSVSFPAPVRQFLATVTDSSGPESSRGFRSAYTGLPVPNTDFYALFCTWPAPEMPRPGCVWSHVLLIDLADLARIPDLSFLRNYFRRPEQTIESLDFDTPLDVEIPEGVPSLNGDFLARADWLLKLLYVTPSTSIAVLSDEATPWEDAVFALWSQQWPKLRRDFTFSTGSLGDRGLAGKAFDLQIASRASKRIWGRETSYSTLVTEWKESSPPSPDDDVCIRAAVADLQNPQSGLREFFFQYGSDLKNPRSGYLPLVQAYNFLRQENGFDRVRLLAAMGDQFPDPRDAVRLKEYLTFPPTDTTSDTSINHALATVTFLFERPEARAYAEVKFDVIGLAKELWDRKRDWVVWQLGRFVERDNPTAFAFASAIASIIEPHDLQNVAEQNSSVALLLVLRRKDLAFDPGTWKLWARTQQEIFDALFAQALSEEEWGKIMGAMLIAATYVSVRQAVERAGQFALPGAFHWLEDPISRTQLPSQPWHDALSMPARDFLHRTDRLPSVQLALATWFCPTDSIRELISPARADVNELASDLGNLPAPLVTSSAFLLMALGLGANDIHGLPLIVRSFHIVNDALASKSHSRESWDLLSRELPFIGWRRDWDRCAKLKLAVHRRLTKYSAQIKASADDGLRDVINSVSSEFGMHQDVDDY